MVVVLADDLPAPRETISGDLKTRVSYELEDDKIKKVKGGHSHGYCSINVICCMSGD